MKIKRRKFMSSTFVTMAAASIVPRHVLGGSKFVPPSEKVNVALVGAGGQGRTNSRILFNQPDVQIIALADPIERSNLESFYYRGIAGRKPVLAEIEKHYSKTIPNFQCKEYVDFRIMLDKEKDIDAVLCTTPDHLHAYVTIAAMRAGKHVYCEKPLAHNIWETRLVADVAEQTGVATQMGNQGHSREGIRQTCELIWDGAIGDVREVHAWVPTGRRNKELMGRPADSSPVPAGVNWELWLGPREPRPYHPAYTPVKWRDFWAFGLGTLGDFGCHDLDAAFWALDLQQPVSVEAFPAGHMNDEIIPHGEICYYEFGARGDKPPLKLTWYDGGLKPKCPAEMDSLPRRGILFVGDKGRMFVAGAGGAPKLLQDGKTRKYAKPPKTLPRSKGHHRDWLDACKGGPPAGSNFGYGAKLTELILLGILSLRTGRKILWNAADMTAKGVPKAEAIIKGSYRQGWEINKV